MPANRLEQFILVQLFKLPVVFLVVALLGAAGFGALSIQSKAAQQLVQRKGRVNLSQVTTLGHLVNTNSTLAAVLKAAGLDSKVQILSNNPCKLETDLDTAQKLEQHGLLIQEISFLTNKVTLTLRPYPAGK